METKNDLLENLNLLKTTDLGNIRIKRNLNLDVEDIVGWCVERIKNKDAQIVRQGKNWYVVINNARICINASSYTIITAHKIDKIKEVV